MDKRKISRKVGQRPLMFDRRRKMSSTFRVKLTLSLPVLFHDNNGSSSLPRFLLQFLDRWILSYSTIRLLQDTTNPKDVKEFRKPTKWKSKASATWPSISSFLSSCHEKATEAQCIERIQTRLGVALVSEFSGGVLLLTSSICCLLDSTKQR